MEARLHAILLHLPPPAGAAPDSKKIEITLQLFISIQR